MARFLLALHDAGGTVPPMQAIAGELAGRGHDVVVLGQPSVRERMEAAGATFEPFSTLPDYDHTKGFEEQLELVGPAMVGHEVGEDLLRLDADACLVDCNLAGALSAAETTGTPSAVLLHSVLRTYVDIWFGELWPLLAPGIAETRTRFGLDQVSSWHDLFARHDRAYSVVPEAFDAPTAPLANLVHVGWTVPGAPPEPVPRGRPVVLLSLSTTAMGDRELIQATLDGLGALNVRGIATIVDRVGHRELRVPGNVSVRDMVPHAALLPSVDVVVTHAGLGTVAAALSHGVPLVCTPIERDQPLNGTRVADLGAGIVVEQPTAANIVLAVQRVLDHDEFRTAAQSVAGNRGAVAAADDLEELLAGTRA